MITDSLVDEKELILSLFDLEEKLHLIEREKGFIKSSLEKTKIEELEIKTKEEYGKVCEKLERHENPLASISIHNHLISTFSLMKSIISNVRFDLPVSRNQSFMFENYFAVKIFEEIRKVINLDFMGISRPFLYFTTEPNDSFDKIKLILFFEKEIDILKQTNPLNYIAIKEYYNNFKERLRILIQ